MASRPFAWNQLFFVIALGTLTTYSAYDLFFAEEHFIFTMAGRSPAGFMEPERDPAAVTPAFLPLTLTCAKNSDVRTKAQKTRLTLTLCRPEGPEGNNLVPNKDGMVPTKTSVINQTNSRDPATIFVDKGNISTAFINLNNGPNVLHIEYSYADGASVTQEVTIIRE